MNKAEMITEPSPDYRKMPSDKNAGNNRVNEIDVKQENYFLTLLKTIMSLLSKEK